MKRSRDDANAVSRLDAPGSSRRDSYEQSQGLRGGGNTCMQGANLPRLTSDDAFTFLKQVKVTFLDQSEKYDMFLEVMKNFKAQRIGITDFMARVSELFKGHNNLILGFNPLLPTGYEITLGEDETPLEETVVLERAINLKNKIKSRFQKGDVYRSFGIILILHRMGLKDIGEVYSEVAALFVDHPDLLDDFARLLADTSAAPTKQNISHICHPILHFKKRKSVTPMAEQKHIDKWTRRDRLLNSDCDLVTDHLEFDNKTVVKEHKVQKRRAEKESRAHRNHYQVDTDRDNDKDGDYISPHFHKKESVMKSDDFGTNAYLVPIRELDLSNCKRCTPCYRLLPDDYPIPSATQRSELGAQVLNDHWVAVASGSGDYCKPKQMSQYEASLFQCEEARFELDMLLESVSSAVKRVEELLSSIKENKINISAAFRIEDHFTAQNLRCIERLYVDNGLDVIDILHGNPAVAFPVIRKRLKQKHEEWTKCRADLNKFWAGKNAKNRSKSIDHCSFDFMQRDS